jgi:hypothetical protein
MMPEPGDELFEELRSVLRRTDPVPAKVTDFAKAALGWRRLDAELAELLEDSVLESESTALTRGGGGRSLTFRTDDLTIDVEIQDGHLLGQLAPPPAAASVELQGEDGAVTASVETDGLGRFRLELGGEGRFRLRIVRRDPAGGPVETSWFSL